MNEVIREIIIDADIVVPTGVVAYAEYSMPVVKEFEKTDLFRQNTFVFGNTSIVRNNNTAGVIFANNKQFDYANPSENDVKVGVVYGLNRELVGRYTPTVLTDEQLQRIANCATMDEVAQLSITIANKDNEE